MESSNPNYELFIQEIEGVDDYWGPTFKAIYECDEPLKFMEQLDKRIQHHDKDIERMCSTYYQGFIESIRDLQLVRHQAKSLNSKVIEVGNGIQEASKKFENKCQELLQSRLVEQNIVAAINAMVSCNPVFTTYIKFQKQMKEKKYYSALKTLNELEHVYLPRFSHLKFLQPMIENIPKDREEIKKESINDFTTFLENIRRLSTKIGEVAMRHTAEQLRSDMETFDVNSSQRWNNDEENEDVFFEPDEDISAQHLIDFAPIYKCLQIQSVLGSQEEFKSHYRQQRIAQARIEVKVLFTNFATISQIEDYLKSIVGFFVQENHILNTGNGITDKTYVDNLWTSCLTDIIGVLQSQTVERRDENFANFLLRLKQLILLFAASLMNYGYSVSRIYEFLHQLKDRYNEVLMERWVDVFKKILEKETFLPKEVKTLQEYELVLQTFPYTDNMEIVELPKTFPFSSMVPQVYHEVKEFIYAGLKFTEDLRLSQKDIRESMRNSTTLLLSKTFGGCLSVLFNKPNLTLPEITQIIIDTGYLEKSSDFLEQFFINITGSAEEKHSIPTRNNINLFNDARSVAEKQICSKLKLKINEFLELENYDWTLVEPKGHASSFITDLIAFLKTTFQSFTNLPNEVAQKACNAACQQIAKCLMQFLLTDDVKSITMGAIQQIDFDTMQCEFFAASNPVPHLEEEALLHYFKDLRELLDLIMTGDWSAYFHDYGRDTSKYKNVNPITAIIVLEKLGAEKKSVFTIKKNEREKQKLLGTVLKQLRQLASINYDRN